MNYKEDQMTSKDKLNKKLEFLNNEIEDMTEDLKHNLEFIEIDKINLLNYHFQLKDLIFKREEIKSDLFYLDDK